MPKVADLIKKLQQMPADAEVYYGQFCGFLDYNYQIIRPQNAQEIPDIEAHELFSIDCELKSVYCWSNKQQKYIPYHGVIFEPDN